MATALRRSGEVGGALGGIRTHGLSLRRAALYPSELQAPETGPGDLCDYDTREGGAEGEIRTPTPLRALRPERSASAVSPLRHVGLPVIIPPGSWWAMQDSNLRPLRCERSALTS